MFYYSFSCLQVFIISITLVSASGFDSLQNTNSHFGNTSLRTSNLHSRNSSSLYRYSHAHSLGEVYRFGPEWENVHSAGLFRTHALSQAKSNEYDNATSGGSILTRRLWPRWAKDGDHRSKHRSKSKDSFRSKDKTKNKPSWPKPQRNSKPTGHGNERDKGGGNGNGKPQSGGRKSLLGTVEVVLENTWNGLKAVGKATSVTITWYTGQDLLHPRFVRFFSVVVSFYRR